MSTHTQGTAPRRTRPATEPTFATSIKLTPAQQEFLEQYRREHGHRSRTEAISALVDKAMGVRVASATARTRVSVERLVRGGGAP